MAQIGLILLLPSVRRAKGYDKRGGISLSLDIIHELTLVTAFLSPCLRSVCPLLMSREKERQKFSHKYTFYSDIETLSFTSIVYA